MSDVEVTILDLTKPVTQKGFGLPLVLDIGKNIPYTEVTKTSEIPAPLVDGDFAYEMIAVMLGQSPSPEKVAVYGYDIDQEGGVLTISQALDALAVEHNDFYFLLIADRTDANIDAIATWAAANEKFAFSSNDPAETVANIAARAGNHASDRSAIFAHDGGIADADPYLDAAIVGRMCPIFPGSSTYKYKQLNGVPVSTYLNADLTTLLNANVNSYVLSMGDLITNEGKETKGGYIDIRIAKDWLKSRIIEILTQLLHSSEKLPFDDSGIALIGSKIKEVLRYAVTKGIIAKDTEGNGLWSLTLPLRENTPTSTRANRILPDIYWEATVAGAVHNIQVTGVIKV